MFVKILRLDRVAKTGRAPTCDWGIVNAPSIALPNAGFVTHTAN